MKKIKEFEGEVLKGRDNQFEVIDEIGDSLNEVLAEFEDKKVIITIEEI